MCGIAGLYIFTGDADNAGKDADINTSAITTDNSIDAFTAFDALTDAMSESLSHRGPDDSGKYSNGKMSLIHRRLSIIDITPEGKQPMSNEDESILLVFNGEIYNYLELREELIQKGHTFKTKTDSEVIIHSYEEWGYDCLKHFNGMWSFAIWNNAAGELFCARDRLGIKPFYYTKTDSAFIFASEIKALCCEKSVGNKVNDAKLITFLKWGLSDYDEETMFEGIYQLLPGHYLTIRDDTINIGKYWDTNPSDLVHSKEISDDAIAKEFLDLLDDSVRLHMRSDVPVGTCLSGGLDSSTITALINRQIANAAENSGNVPVQNTFSAVFDDKRFDESHYIKVMTSATDVSAHLISPDPKNLWNDLPHLLYSNDEPFLQLTLYSQYCIMREIGRNVKVVLDGQGADEMLAGYIAYFYCYVSYLLKSGHILRAAGEGLGILKKHRSFLRYAISQLFIRKKRRGLIIGEEIPLKRYQGRLNQALNTDLKSTNLPYLLHWEDRMSMAFAVEARVPFLDYRVVEFLSSLPEDQKIRGGVTKYILRNAIKGIVPEEIRLRMDKKGFSTPEEVWMKDDLKDNILSVLNSESFRARKYWNADEVLKAYRDFLDGKSKYSSEIWRIVCTEMWLRMFFDSRSDGCALPNPHVFSKV